MQTNITLHLLTGILRSKFALGYTLFLFVLAMAMFLLETNTTKSIVGLMNVLLWVIPLCTLVYSTVHLYNAYEFFELMATQPIPRKKIIRSEWLSLSLALNASFLVGIGIPVLAFVPLAIAILIVVAGMALTTIFVSLSCLFGISFTDRTKGIGVALFCWLFFALIFDAIILFLLFSFSDYPTDKLVMVMSLLNPLDMARLVLLLQLNVSSIMGYTGAVFSQTVGSTLGIIILLSTMIAWMLLPAWMAQKLFEKKDF
jgi:Cu-processing system permease protein